MPQEEEKGKKIPPMPKDWVLPQDDVTVYATDKLAGIYEEGQAFVAHSALAKKLIKQGKATEEAPKAKKTKEEKPA